MTGRMPAFQACLSEIATLRISVFREYPYLYAGSLAYEEAYLATYSQSPESFAVLVRDGIRIVGVSTGLPLLQEADAFQQPFRAEGIDVREIFYCGESVLLPDYRGRGTYRTFMARREAHARALGFGVMALCGVIRACDHLARPSGYRSLDPVWLHFGYTPQPKLRAYLAWPEVPDHKSSVKALQFWLKRL